MSITYGNELLYAQGGDGAVFSYLYPTGEPGVDKCIARITQDSFIAVYEEINSATFDASIKAVIGVVSDNNITYSAPYEIDYYSGGEVPLQMALDVIVLSPTVAIVSNLKLVGGVHTGMVYGVAMASNVITASGSRQIFSVGNNVFDIALVALTETTFCTTWTDTVGGVDNLYARFGSAAVPSFNVTWGSSVIISPSDWSSVISATHLTAEKVVVVWGSEITKQLRATVITISGSTITPGTVYNLTEAELYRPSAVRVRRMSNTKAFLTWAQRPSASFQFRLWAEVLNIDGSNAVSEGPRKDILGALHYSYKVDSAVLTSNKAVIIHDYYDTIETCITHQCLINEVDVISVESSDPWPGTYRVRFFSIDRLTGRKFVGNGVNAFQMPENNWEAVAYAVIGNTSGDVYALSHAIDRQTGDLCYVTTHSSGILRLNIYDLTTQSIVKVMAFGAATSEQVQDKTRILYPYHSFDGYLYLFGNFTNPDTSSVAHILRTNDLGVTLEIVENSWGTDSCSGFVKGSSRMVAARSIVGGTEIYSGTSSLVKVATLPFVGHIDKRAMKIQYTNNRVVVGAKTGQSVMVLQSYPPYTSWSNITLNHGIASGINALDIIY